MVITRVCQVCDACFLHVLATIDSIAGRRLSERRLKVPQKLFESLPIVVKAKPPIRVSRVCEVRN